MELAAPLPRQGPRSTSAPSSACSPTTRSSTCRCSRSRCALPVAYVGAMGSRRTNDDRLKRLRENGLTEAELARLHAPIGLDVGARTPEETAVSIAAEIIASRWGGTGSAAAQHHRADPPRARGSLPRGDRRRPAQPSMSRERGQASVRTTAHRPRRGGRDDQDQRDRRRRARTPTRSSRERCSCTTCASNSARSARSSAATPATAARAPSMSTAHSVKSCTRARGTGRRLRL